MLTDQERERVANRAPVWLQDIIYTLDRQLAERDAHIERLSVGDPDSNVRINDHVYPERKLGRNVTVDFAVGGGFVQVLHDKHDEDAVEVRVVGSGRKHRMAIRPSSGNTVVIRLTD